MGIQIKWFFFFKNIYNIIGIITTRDCTSTSHICMISEKGNLKFLVNNLSG